jgi:hypothetical protein
MLDIATLVSAILAFIAAIANIIVTVKNARKRDFIGVVTKVRHEYIQKLRKLVAEFCALATAQQPLDEVKYHLKLMMNPAGPPAVYEKWDGKAVELINKIDGSNQTGIDDLIKLMQSWLALEWEGMMREAKKGTLTEEEKNELRNKYYKQYTKNK